MRNSMDITRSYQFGKMILCHFTSVLICIVFEAVACWQFLAEPVWQYVIAAIFTFVYAILIYSMAHKLAGFDRKSYTPLKPSLKWGFLWGVVISATIAVAVILFKLNWLIFSVDMAMNNVFSIIYNLLFYIWTAPYYGFIISESGGNIQLFVIVLMLAVPIVASTLGYLAGMNNFELIVKLDSMTVEKQDDDDED